MLSCSPRRKLDKPWPAQPGGRMLVETGLRELLVFDLLGFDTVFMNETVRDYCRDGGIVFTRCRPWRKND